MARDPMRGWKAVHLQRMADTSSDLDPTDAELYTAPDLEDIRAMWDEANPNATGMLDARPWTGAVAGE